MSPEWTTASARGWGSPGATGKLGPPFSAREAGPLGSPLPRMVCAGLMPVNRCPRSPSHRFPSFLALLRNSHQPPGLWGEHLYFPATALLRHGAGHFPLVISMCLLRPVLCCPPVLKMKKTLRLRGGRWVAQGNRLMSVRAEVNPCVLKARADVSHLTVRYLRTASCLHLVARTFSCTQGWAPL